MTLSKFIQSAILAGALASAPVWAQTGGSQPATAQQPGATGSGAGQGNAAGSASGTAGSRTDATNPGVGTPSPGSAYNPVTGTTDQTNPYRDHATQHNFGWIGLIGLAGLFGLVPRRNRYDTTAGTSDTTVGRMPPRS